MMDYALLLILIVGQLLTLSLLWPRQSDGGRPILPRPPGPRTKLKPKAHSDEDLWRREQDRE